MDGPPQPPSAVEIAALSQQSRHGYSGDGGAGSNAVAGEERIVLSADFGGANGNSLAALDIAADAAREQLAGCANRYVGKVVIITGAARGIGEGCARVFFEAGAHVVVVDRDADGGEAIAAELNGRSTAANRAIFLRADVSVAPQLERVVLDAVAEFGRLDCVVNNAGWHPPHAPIDDFDVADCQNLMQLNFVSTFALCKYALPHLRKTKGNIVNMSSLVGAFGQSRATTYAATKGAITAFTKALAIDEAKHGVRVNAVSPGNIWTPLWKAGADADADPAAARAAGEKVQCLGRMGTILEAGRLCLCIAADLTFTTGVDHILSGGAEIGYGMRA